jgi:hypothetical protein
LGITFPLLTTLLQTFLLAIGFCPWSHFHFLPYLEIKCVLLYRRTGGWRKMLCALDKQAKKKKTYSGLWNSNKQIKKL